MELNARLWKQIVKLTFHQQVTLKGFKESIEIAKAKIESIVKDLESMITIECVIPQKHHRTVMGSKGTKVQNITSDYKVQIKFPERDTQGMRLWLIGVKIPRKLDV